MADIEDIRDTLRAHVRRCSDALWALDSATSLRRKAESGVYRSSETTGDAAWDIETYQNREALAAERSCPAGITCANLPTCRDKARRQQAT